MRTWWRDAWCCGCGALFGAGAEKGSRKGCSPCRCVDSQRGSNSHPCLLSIHLLHLPLAGMLGAGLLCVVGLLLLASGQTSEALESLVAELPCPEAYYASEQDLTFFVVCTKPEIGHGRSFGWKLRACTKLIAMHGALARKCATLTWASWKRQHACMYSNTERWIQWLHLHAHLGQVLRWAWSGREIWFACTGRVQHTRKNGQHVP